MSRTRVVLVLTVVVALVAVVLLAFNGSSGPSTTDSGDPSSRNAGRDGTLALYEWLGDLGFDMHRVSGDFDVTSTDVLLVVAPSESFTTDEISRIDGFLQAGGELVLAVSPQTLPAAQPMLDSLGLGIDRATAPGTATPAPELDPTRTLDRVVFADPGVDVGNAGTPLMTLTSGRVVLSAFTVGAGHAYVLGSPYPLSNEGLRFTRPDSDGVLRPTGSDAYALALALVEKARPQGPVVRVGVDEVHHGEGATGGLGAILIGPLGLALALALLVVVGWLATSGRRMGGHVPAGDPSAVPTAATFVGAMAQLYERSAHRGAVAGRYAAELKESIAAATGIDPHVDDDTFVAALRGHGEDRVREVGLVLSRARALQGSSPSDSQLLELARAVDEVEARWTPGAAMQLASL